MKKTITLDVNPVEILGAGNKILNEFCTYFSSLKVQDKGNEIIVEGPQDQVEDFVAKFPHPAHETQPYGL